MKAEQAQQKRRVQTLQFLNSVLSDLIGNGFNMSPLIIETISKKKVLNVQDIEQLAQLTVTQKNSTVHKQNKGEYQPVSYEQISLEKYKTMKSLTMASQRSEEMSSSSFDKKLETVTRGVKIVVKVHRN